MKRWEQKYYTFEETEGANGIPHFTVFKGDEKLGMIKPEDKEAYERIYAGFESGADIAGFEEGVLITEGNE